MTGKWSLFNQTLGVVNIEKEYYLEPRGLVSGPRCFLNNGFSAFRLDILGQVTLCFVKLYCVFHV